MLNYAAEKPQWMLCNKHQCIWETADIALSDKVCLGHRNLSSTTALRTTCYVLKGAKVRKTIPTQKWQWVYTFIRHLLHVPPLFLTQGKRHFCRLAQAAVTTDHMCLWVLIQERKLQCFGMHFFVSVHHYIFSRDY